MKCVTCDIDESSETGQLLACDKCGLPSCQDCIRLSTTEMRSVLLKKRSLIYLCTDCRPKFDRFVQTDGTCRGTNDAVDESAKEDRIREIVVSTLEELIPIVFKTATANLATQISDVDLKIDMVLKRLQTAGKVENVEAQRNVVGAGFAVHSGSAIQPLSSVGCQRSVELSVSTSSAETADLTLAKDNNNVNKNKQTYYKQRKRRTSRSDSGPVLANAEYSERKGTEKEPGPITLSQLDRGIKNAMKETVGVDGDAGVGAFKLVENRGDRRRRLKDGNARRGTADTASTNGFVSEPRKMWLYVGRAGSQTSKEIVEKYVKERLKLKDDQLVVEDLRTVGSTRSFKVGVDSRFYDEAMKAEFWPDGILFRRFRFSAGRHNAVLDFPVPGSESTER